MNSKRRCQAIIRFNVKHSILIAMSESRGQDFIIRCRVGLVAGLNATEPLNVLVKLDKLLDKHRIGYIVVDSLADYLLGISVIMPNEIDILISKENVGKPNTVIQLEYGIDMLKPVRWREEGMIRGLYGRSLLDGVPGDIMADVQFKYPGKWGLFIYEKLLPCTMETKINDVAIVRIPCSEIQVIADKALGRLERVKAIEDVIDNKECSLRINYCLLTI